MTRKPLELSLVMPVYNESAIIDTVLSVWMRQLERLGIRYEFLVYDDGSEDGTPQILNYKARESDTLKVRCHANRGHGPTISRGYLEATGKWVFQTDSDDETPAGFFEEFWKRREEYDFLIGCRRRRKAPASRRIVSVACRVSVGLLFGRGLRDVNSPYRLMRSGWVQEVVARLPEDTFAPNVILSGIALRQGLRILEIDIPHRQRRTGTVSIARWGLWKGALKTFVQTVRAATIFRKRS